MTNALSLASRLRSLDDAGLRAAIDARGVAPGRIQDFFDLAEAVLDPDSIGRALAALDRGTLAVIAAAVEVGEDTPITTASITTTSAITAAIGARLERWGAPGGNAGATVTGASVVERLERASELLLVQPAAEGYLPYRAVAGQLNAWPGLGLPSAAELAASAPPVAIGTTSTASAAQPGAGAADQLAADHAFGAVSAIAELLAELAHEPARELQKGGLALPEAKRVANAMSLELAEVPTRLSIAVQAQLVALESGLWLATDAGTAWALRPTSERWGALADAWLSALSPEIRSVLAALASTGWGHTLRSFLTWFYPAGGEPMQRRVSEVLRDAEVLGISSGLAPRRPGVLLLEQGVDAAATALATRFPHEVGQVYLQHDLSIVSPGPLDPAVDARLRTMADVESRALASSYRVSAASVNRAVARGETAASILDFLAEISLTGIPQPVEYLVNEAAARYGRLRVREATADVASGAARARSWVHSEDTELLRTLEVDQSLSALGLQRVAEKRLASRFERDTVFWAVSDARYPIAAEDATGRILNLRRRPSVRAERRPGADGVTELIGRLRASAASGDDETTQAWLVRQLEIAIRGKTTVSVTVELPDGRAVEYLLEPTGVAGGRLRGRDRLADVERTVPLSNITGLKPSDHRS